MLASDQVFYGCRQMNSRQKPADKFSFSLVVLSFQADDYVITYSINSYAR